MSSTKLDLLGEKLFVVAAENSPHVLKNLIGNDHVTKVGYEYKIMQNLADKFNFTYQLRDAERDTGRLLSNGTWTGVIGYLVDGTADIGFGGLTITMDRLKYVDYLSPHYSSPITFITNWPKTQTTHFMTTIDSSIIWSIVLSLVLIMFTIKLITHLFVGLQKCHFYWIILVIALRQNINYKFLKKDSIRILMLTWQFAALLVSLMLGGLIYKSVSLPKKLQTIDNLLQLSEAMKSGLIQVFINKNSARYTELKNSNRGTIKDIYKRLSFLKKGQRAVSMVRNSDVAMAYIDYRIKFDYELFEQGEKTYHMPPDDPDSNFRSAYFALAVKKDFKYIKQFTEQSKKIITSGIILYLLRIQKNYKSFKYHTDPQNSGIENNNEDQSFAAILKSLIFICYIGLSLSCLILIIEFILTSRKIISFFKTL